MRKNYKQLLNTYISRISNPNMRNFIRFRSEQTHGLYSEKPIKHYSYFDVEAGINDEHLHFLMDPNLSKNVIIGFDMDYTLHQMGYFTNILTKNFIDILSKLTKSKISYNDIGEYYFGGKERLKKMKDMFQNLNKTIGMYNVYVITANPSTLIKEIIPDLYSKLFNIKFKQENVKVTVPNKVTKYDIIKQIMNI